MTCDRITVGKVEAAKNLDDRHEVNGIRNAYMNCLELGASVGGGGDPRKYEHGMSSDEPADVRIPGRIGKNG